MFPERIVLPEVSALLAKQETHQKLPLSSLENVPPFIREKAERIAEITGTWNPVEIYTADAESITKAKAELFEHFDRGEHYTPELTYSTAEKMDVTEARTELQTMLDEVRATHYDRDDRVSRLARVALIAKLQDDLASCDLVDGINTKREPMIKRAIGRKYMGSDAELSKIVHETYEGLTHFEEKSTGSGKYSLEDMKLLTEKEFNAEEIKVAFEWGLDQLGILGEGGFKVVIDPRVTSIDVRDKSANGPTVFIPPPRKVTGRYLLELLNHEIGSHCRQSMNGARLFQIGGGALKLDEETLYEGLAMREENELTTDYFGEAEVYALPYYALAIEQAEQGKTFYEIFSHMYEIRLHAALSIPPNDLLPTEIDQKIREKAKNGAWLNTYRVMRGHTNMDNPESFAMTKDLAYLRGAHLDRQLVEAGLGHLNETAIIARGGGLLAIAEFDIKPADLPIPFQNLADMYFQEVIKIGQQV